MDNVKIESSEKKQVVEAASKEEETKAEDPPVLDAIMEEPEDADKSINKSSDKIVVSPVKTAVSPVKTAVSPAKTAVSPHKTAKTAVSVDTKTVEDKLTVVIDKKDVSSVKTVSANENKQKKEDMKVFTTLQNLILLNKIPRQKPKSGKFWKDGRSQFRALKKDKGQRYIL